MIKVDKFTFDLTIRRLRGARKRTLPMMIAGMQDATGVLGGEVRNNIAVDEGNLQRSEWDGVTDIRPTESMVQGKATMKAPGKTQLPYAWMEEEGGWIFPKISNRIQRLVWTDKTTGAVIFARKVYHKGKHYMANALPAVKGTVEGILKSAMTGIFNRYD